MKKRILLAYIIFGVLALSVFASAFWPFGNSKSITGNVVSDGCVDSDGGKNADVFGNVSITKRGKVITTPDKCGSKGKNNENILFEAYCFKGKAKQDKINCPSGTCLAGKCISKDYNKCIDSDGGNNTILRGTTTFKDESLTDNCYGSDNELNEYSCFKGKITRSKVDCKHNGFSGCKDGACIQQAEEPVVNNSETNSTTPQTNSTTP
ncbi:MAG: hypothetical protein AABW65_00435 [Nanoarchaeota archaeon]